MEGAARRHDRKQKKKKIKRVGGRKVTLFADVILHFAEWIACVAAVGASAFRIAVEKKWILLKHVIAFRER